MDDKRDKGRGQGGGKPGDRASEGGKEGGQGRRRFGRRRFGRGPRGPGEGRGEAGQGPLEQGESPAPSQAGQRDGRGQGGQNGPGNGARQGGSKPAPTDSGRTRVPERRPEPVLEKAEKVEPRDCPLCGKPVYDLSTAVGSDMESGAPAHFDCVLERVTAAETLAPGERIVYLGSGAFGVVEFKDKSETAFTVKRRIQWEKEGEKKDWRRGLSARISKI